MKVSQITESSELLLAKCEIAAVAFEDKFGRPRPYTVNSRFSWKYDENRLEHVCVFRVVRIISAFRGCSVLLEKGYLQETAVLLRTIVEFLNELVFLIEGYPTGLMSNHQRRFVDECFKEHFKNHLNISEGVQPRNIVPRRKVHAAKARTFSAFMNQLTMQRITDMEEDVYNGYIHATAPCTLEFYGLGDTVFPEFSMHGITHVGKTKAWLDQFSIYLHRFANRVSVMCEYFDLKQIGHSITNQRMQFEQFVGKELSLSFTKKGSTSM